MHVGEQATEEGGQLRSLLRGRFLQSSAQRTAIDLLHDHERLFENGFVGFDERDAGNGIAGGVELAQSREFSGRFFGGVVARIDAQDQLFALWGFSFDIFDGKGKDLGLPAVADAGEVGQAKIFSLWISVGESVLELLGDFFF